jgi:hypothetical protein
MVDICQILYKNQIDYLNSPIDKSWDNILLIANTDEWKNKIKKYRINTDRSFEFDILSKKLDTFSSINFSSCRLDLSSFWVHWLYNILLDVITNHHSYKTSIKIWSPNVNLNW